MSQSMMPSVKLVVVGDSNVGKTTLMHRYCSGTFNPNAYPTTYVPYMNLTLDGKQVHLGLWWTDGSYEYDRLRPISYPQTDVFLLCFSLVCDSSFDRIATKWTPELRHHCPDVPVVVVGTKADLKQDPDTAAVAGERAGVSYLECSSLTGQGVTEVFEAAMRAALARRSDNLEGNCCLV